MSLFQQLLAADVAITAYQQVLNRATALGYTLPTAGEQTTQNQLIVDLQAAGIWSLLDVFWPMFTNSNFATLNWKNPLANQITLVNSPTYNAATGFEGNGTTSYLNTNWAPASGVNFTQNEAGAGGGNANDLNNTSMLYGASNASSNNSLYLQPRASGNLISRINQSASTSVANASSIGRYHQKRTASNAVAVFKNGASITTGTTGSATRTANNVYLCARNSNGTADLFSTRQILYFWAGASLNGLEATMDAILDTYY